MSSGTHGKTQSFDAIVVGSGAAGGFAAKELTEGGLDVVLLEAGDLIHPDDFPVPSPHAPVATTKDRLLAALQGRHVQSRCTSFSPMTRHLFVDDRLNPYTTAKNSPFSWFRTRKIGGRMHLWGRHVMRWSDLYFKAADHDGCGVNWPLSYSDIEPYYCKVEKFLGVYGTRDGVPHLPDSEYTGPRELTQKELELARIVKQKWPERYVIPARTIKHNPHRVPLPLIAAEKTGRLTTRANAVVRSITVDAQTRLAAGVNYVDSQQKTDLFVKSNIVVLCASPIETVRILFNSAGPGYPSGIGNSSGLLGQYIMDHSSLLFFGPVSEDELSPATDESEDDPWDLAKSSGFYIPRFRNVLDKHPDFYRGYGIHGGIGRTPNFWWILVFGQMIPAASNRISVNRRKKDAWGIPAAHIECARSENDYAMADDAMRTVTEILDQTRLVTLENSKRHRQWMKTKPLQSFVFNQLLKTVFAKPHLLHLGAGIHELGGARMGADPKTSVLNGFNQCWDVKNVFVTDGACFPSSGEHHTLTTMALTVRACDYILKEYSQGRL